MNSKVTELINQQASEWFVLMQADAVTQDERSAFLHWLDESPEHRDAYATYEQIWHDLGDLAVSAEGKRLRRSVNSISAGSHFARYVRVWFSGVFELFGKTTKGNEFKDGGSIVNGFRTGRFAVAGLFLFLFAFLINNFLTNDVHVQSYQTGIAQIQKIRLDDGTSITLSGKTRIATWNTESERHVELAEGQAFFEVAKNKDKPFYVKTGETLIKVVGTQFDVNHSGGKVRVAVLEGVVNVSAIETNVNTLVEKLPVFVLTAGLQVSRSSDGKFSAVEKSSTTNFANWRNGQLVYSNARLCDVIDDVNRFSQHPITLDEKLHDVRVTIAFDVEQVESLPMLLSKMLPVTSVRDASGKIIILPSSN